MKHGMMKTKRLLAAALVLILVPLVFAMATSADYYLTGIAGIDKQNTPKSFELVRTIGNFEGISEMKNPNDLFIDQNDNLYILDSDNSRIVVTDKNGTILRIIEGSYGVGADGSGPQPLNQPQGLYVDEIGDIFIADTENGRILHLTGEGAFVEEFFQPTEETYDETYPFKPSHVAVDSMGRMFCTNFKDYHGVIVIDGENHFSGYIGATKIEVSFVDKLLEIFASEEQKEALAREVPAYYSNFVMKDNFLYAVSYWDETNQIKKLTPAGSNIYSDMFYGEENMSTVFNYLPAFKDIAVDENEIIYVADGVTNKIYVYDQNSNNLAVFGGKGKRDNKFDTIGSIAVDSQGDLYVLDSVMNTIQVFTPTERMQYILSGTTMYNEGRYEDAVESWGKVLEYDSTNILANVGMAKAAYRNDDYAGAMELYKVAFNRAGYSEAYYYYRLDFIRQYFIWVFLGVVAVIVLLCFLISKVKKYADRISSEPLSEKKRLGLRGTFRAGILLIFHPIDCFYAIKYSRKKISFLPPIILTVLLMLVHVVYLYAVHFPLSSFFAASGDMWQQVLLFLVPLASWIFVSYALISIADGKQTFREALTANMYSFLPYILLMLPLAGLSHVMSATEAGLYGILTNAVMLWCICLVLLSTKIMNQYSFGKLVGMILIIIFGIICLWMLCMLFYIVVYQAVDFFKDVYEEFAVIQNG